MDGNKACNRYRPDFQNGLGAVASLTGWPTPQEDNANNAYGHKVTTYSDLPTTTQLAGWAVSQGWPTPSTRDHKGGYEGGRIRNGKISTDTLDVVAQIAGQTTMSSPAPTEKRGALNPALPRWLMGFPPEWCDCAVTAMQSFPKSRRNSSKPS
jgi:hypothetical protein